MYLEPTHRAPFQPLPLPALELQGLSQVYTGAGGPVQALRGIHLKVQPGEVFGIIGNSGAGKSALLRSITLLDRPTAGKVLVHGQDLCALAPARLRDARRQIGTVFQQVKLLSSRTVYQNVALPLELTDTRPALVKRQVDSLLDALGLAELRQRYPAQLSGGQQQRVGVARALAGNPKLLLCDEAAAALDPETTRLVLALLRQFNRDFGTTIVLISQQPQVLRQIAHRVAVLDAGRLVEQGSAWQLFTHPRQPVTRGLVNVFPGPLPGRYANPGHNANVRSPDGAA